jgi:hypothetical protein
MSVLGWEAPPANSVGAQEKHTKWKAVADLLKTRPEEWAKVAVKKNRQQAVTLTNGIALGRRPEFEAGAFAARYAEGHDPDGGVEVFAAYDPNGTLRGGSVPVITKADQDAAAAADDGSAWDDDETE